MIWTGRSRRAFERGAMIGAGLPFTVESTSAYRARLERAGRIEAGILAGLAIVIWAIVIWMGVRG